MSLLQYDKAVCLLIPNVFPFLLFLSVISLWWPLGMWPPVFPLTCLITSPPVPHHLINRYSIKDRLNLPDVAKLFSRHQSNYRCGQFCDLNLMLLLTLISLRFRIFSYHPPAAHTQACLHFLFEPWHHEPCPCNWISSWRDLHLSLHITSVT